MPRNSTALQDSCYEQGMCVQCGTRPKMKAGIRDGKVKYKPRCKSCNKYKTYIKLNHCELCGFEAQHECQLDVDHIDGNHENMSPDNLQTLCANCHRLKTVYNKDWEAN